MTRAISSLLAALCLLASAFAQSQDDEAVRVFIFAGQSNMVGADSKVADIERSPPFSGLGAPQEQVRFWHCIGRENKTTSDGWTALQPVRGMVGPELSFARKVTANIEAQVAIIKVAAGGTTPYVHGALDEARARGAGTVFMACVSEDQVPSTADVSIRLLCGPEPVQGSTRMKAGTATKLALNALSTLAMVQLGKVHGGRMVDVDTRANVKLVDRGLRLGSELGPVSRERAAELLEAAEGWPERQRWLNRLQRDALL